MTFRRIFFARKLIQSTSDSERLIIPVFLPIRLISNTSTGSRVNFAIETLISLLMGKTLEVDTIQHDIGAGKVHSYAIRPYWTCHKDEFA